MDVVSKRLYHNLTCTIPGWLVFFADLMAILDYRARGTIEYEDTVHIEVAILGYYVE